MKNKKIVDKYEPYPCPCCGTGMGNEHGDVMCNTCGFLCSVGLYVEIMANRKAVENMKNKRLTIGQLHDILDDKKTDPFLIFDEMMNYLYDKNQAKYKKTLKKVRDWVNLC